MRSDARRNKDDILAAAARAFAEDAQASLEGIAKGAGVGIGTLYRHFPTREALVIAAHRNEIVKLCEAVTALAKNHPPDEALAHFLDQFVDHMVEKPGIVHAMRAVVGADNAPLNESLAMVRAAVAPILDAGKAQGVLRADVTVEDFIIIKGAIALAGPEKGRRLAVLAIDGLRYGARARRARTRAR